MGSAATLNLIKLAELMTISSGSPNISIGLIDGPVLTSHKDFFQENIRVLSSKRSGSCITSSSLACIHGTLVAGMLKARRDSKTPGICPRCTLLIRPIFNESTYSTDVIPSATSEELSDAIIGCIKEGVKIINLSAALVSPTVSGIGDLKQVLDFASRHGVIVVAASGNQNTIGSTSITSHPWVIPVSACDDAGNPINNSNFGWSIGRHGLSAPGNHIKSLGTDGKQKVFGGTSAAAPFVTGTIALLWSEFKNASAYEIKFAVTHSSRIRRTIIPPLLNAMVAYDYLKTNGSKFRHNKK
jgi:subtilisin family serine protease